MTLKRWEIEKVCFQIVYCTHLGLNPAEKLLERCILRGPIVSFRNFKVSFLSLACKERNTRLDSNDFLIKVVTEKKATGLWPWTLLAVFELKTSQFCTLGCVTSEVTYSHSDHYLGTKSHSGKKINHSVWDELEFTNTLWMLWETKTWTWMGSLAPDFLAAAAGLTWSPSSCSMSGLKCPCRRVIEELLCWVNVFKGCLKDMRFPTMTPAGL